jgi:cytochrome c oxidase subunit 2
VTAVLVGLVLVAGVASGCGGTAATSGTDDVTPTAAEPAPTVNVAREVARGKRLADTHGCVGCHTTDGRDQIGPTWTGLYGSSVKLAGGEVVVVDEPYMRRSIRDPNAQIVAGYLPDIMQSFELTEDEITSLVEYIKSLE